MNKYDHRKKPENQKYISLTKIIVPTEYDKEQLLKALEYIHDLKEINTNYLAVNLLAHLHMRPDLIEVENSNDRRT